jgi:hypothetical protein
MTRAKPTYRLIRVDGVEIMVVDDYASYAEAIVARDDDVIKVLAGSGGRYQQITHWILGTDRHGRGASRTVACAVGVDPARPRPLDHLDLIETAHWLTTVHPRAA